MLDELLSSIFSNLSHSLSQLSSAWYQAEPWLISFISVLAIAFLATGAVLGIRAHHRQKYASMDNIVGKSALVKTALNPKGMVLIQGELWKAIIEDGQAEPGDEVIVTKINHLELCVSKNYESVKF